MFPKFNHCGIERTHPVRITGCCSPTPTVGPGAVPESIRMLSQSCGEAIVTTQFYTPAGYDALRTMSTMSTTMYMCSDTERVKILVPVPEGSRPPVVQVGTVPASVTTQQRATDVGLNRYDPVKRFAQYFPPAPLPYICPERIPNNLPLPKETVCLPNTPFITSAQLSTIESMSTLAGISTLLGISTPVRISTPTDISTLGGI